MPDDGIESVTAMVENAQHSLEIKMFLFTARKLQKAVIAAAKRGVRTRLMLNPATRSGETPNERTYAVLENSGVLVKDANPSYVVTHEKSVIVDGRAAMIQSFNWTAKNFTATRDYGVLTFEPLEVEEMLACFNADWGRIDFEPPAESSLIWSPKNARARIAGFIDDAQKSLFLQNERYQDMTIVEHLVRAKQRGVRVHVMSLAPHALKEGQILDGVNGLRLMQDIGIKIRRLKGLRLHAKMILADESRAIVGSINMTPGSLDKRRELAIEVRDPSIVQRLKRVSTEDWHRSYPLDLSDEGLVKDMQKNGPRDLSSLALQDPAAVGNGHRAAS